MEFSFLKIFLPLCLHVISSHSTLLANEISPVVVMTWNFHKPAAKAWETLFVEKRSALDAIEESCNLCENNGTECYWLVGMGGCPDENGKTTLDALIMDGVTMNVGAVGAVKDIKNPISVARKVMENTDHTLLVGESVTQFALQMGFETQELSTKNSTRQWKTWKENNCQPNFWRNVVPNPSTSCGPYRLDDKKDMKQETSNKPLDSETNHDTMGVLALDVHGHIAAGVSTNGLKYKIPGRLGDSPVPGAGTYADTNFGAAACTGVGDISLRFLPSFVAVEEMKRGATPQEAAQTALDRMTKFYPKHSNALITMDKVGNYAVACHGFRLYNYRFPYYVANEKLGKATLMYKACFNTSIYFLDHQGKFVYN
ncbi:N(4)-(Beta-N-acetylglucosaminyl)-L-asparaginase-like [Leptopilina heterotoma]|uniref:N(4)-(Beta-N-acetylglucosaminyl)-L-asparaginase- like n=1 Tax=Leptopilina heterotoma TaxID=63436 RepID=UPI001CA7CF93|nr:N(4)-(Beta-N-acetylglucosaminyl)-L-asparaginase-like [Leptopilina heterotoma]